MFDLLSSFIAHLLIPDGRFATRSERFMDAYRKGLSGDQAAWAGKRYRGHRVLPKNIMALFDRFGRKKN
ncbi:hypothetical protein C8R44DRAFT_613007 [Mycena epipterygia]|nr:hypothetical protein C8R44DRAFT_613007 [Mycena epipterygia]